MTKPDVGHQATLMILAEDQWSKNTFYYGSGPDDYPIARTAVSALGDLVPLGQAYDQALFTIGAGASDPDVRRAIFNLLAKTAGAIIHDKLFDLAVQPGGGGVRRAAAVSLLQAGKVIDQTVIDRITPKLLASRYEPVAGVLAVLLGCRGAIPAIRAAAEELAANLKRRVLLLLVVRVLNYREKSTAEEVAAMLPAGHSGVAWALGRAQEKVYDAMIADLGDHAMCAEVLTYMRTKPAKRKGGAK